MSTVFQMKNLSTCVQLLYFMFSVSLSLMGFKDRDTFLHRSGRAGRFGEELQGQRLEPYHDSQIHLREFGFGEDWINSHSLLSYVFK